MTPQPLDPGGTPTSADKLVVSKARELTDLLALGRPYARLRECRQDEATDVVVLEVDVEVGQITHHDIRRTETLAVRFDRDDRRPPDVLALRANFPRVPHLNLRPQELPRSLCLFEEPYYELKARWTAALLLDRIREWLRLTARGELHAPDQPLEPLLPDSECTIILPSSLFSAHPGALLKPLDVIPIESHPRRLVLRTDPAVDGKPPRLVAAVVQTNPRQHGIIWRMPESILDLHELMSASGDDLLALLRRRLLDWKDTPRALDTQLLLVVVFPKTRTDQGAIESVDVWAFQTHQTVRQVGEAVGLWTHHAGNIAALLQHDEAKRGQDVKLLPLNVVYKLSRAVAAHVNGFASPSEVSVAAVGAGALGSHVIMNAARAAFGRWTVIDDDILLPHNLARHAMDGAYAGYPKATAVAETVNRLMDTEPTVTALVANALDPVAEGEAVRDSLEASDVIVDFSAAPAVARYLARDSDASARRASFFLNPAGSDLIFLLEGRDRAVPLDALEMQYYRAIAHMEELKGHLTAPVERLRYGRTCRDRTVRLPQDFVALHGAIATRALRAGLETEGPVARVWRLDPTTLAVRVVDIEPCPISERQVGDWTVCLDACLRERLAGLRDERLPNETGGVLLGSVDLERKIAHVVDAVPSPSDSAEYPTLYVRGSKSLAEQVRIVEDRTLHQLHYVGEWHSHPDGYSCEPSEDDHKVLRWLGEHMAADGLPGVVLIVGRAVIAPFVVRGGMVFAASVSPPLTGEFRP